MHILHIEDSVFDAELIGRLLVQEWPDCQIQRAATKTQLVDRLQSGPFDIVLSDFTLGDIDGLSALEMTRRHFPKSPFIFLSGTIGEDRAVDALKRGASDYVLKDRPARLVPAIRRAMAAAEEAELHLRTSAALDKSEARIREQAALLDKAQDAILACDLQNRITYWNKGAARIYGWTSEEVAGKEAISLLAVDPSLFEAARSAALKRGEWHGELLHRTKSGEKVTVQSGWTLVQGEGKGLDAFLIINTDITERKRIESQFLRAQRTESLGLMAGGIAHDLNNVFGPILTSLELLRPSLSDPEAATIMGHMDSSAKHGVSLVRQLLAFARGVDGHPEDIYPAMFLPEFANFIRSTLTSSVNVSVEIKQTPPPIRADITQLKQVLVNLCINAKDAMGGQGAIVLGLDRFELRGSDAMPHPDARPGNYAMISVADSGSGIAPADLDRIFEPFFTTKEEGKGTGLGLATVRGIVKGHRGFVTVDSEVGRGTVFRLYFPTCEPAAAVNVPPVSAKAAPKSLILLIDDDPAVRMIMELLLKSFGHEVLAAEDGRSGLKLFEQRKDQIALVITDLQMAEMSGVAFIRRLRALDKALPVLAMSGYSGDATAGSQLGSLGVHLLAKPVSRDDLLAAIQGALAARA